MTALKAHEVGRFLDRPDLEEGLFLAYGPDAGLVREAGSRLARRFAGSDKESMNLVLLDASDLDADPSRLSMEARTGSLFGEKRVLRVRGATKSLAPALAEFKDQPAGAAIILEAGNLAPRDPLRALVEAARSGRALPCYPDSDEALQQLIAETFSKAGIRTEPEVIPTLRDLLGNDREVTRRELEKLKLHAQETKLLTRLDVLMLCADNSALALDEVLDAAGSGHAANLELALNRALAASVEPQQLLIASLSHFAALRRWRGEVDMGRSAREVLDGARPRPHFSRRSTLEQQLRLWSDDRLAAVVNRLHLSTGESRKAYELQETIARRALLAVCMMAAEH